jgi:hypothetical protein
MRQDFQVLERTEVSFGEVSPPRLGIVLGELPVPVTTAKSNTPNINTTATTPTWAIRATAGPIKAMAMATGTALKKEVRTKLLWQGAKESTRKIVKVKLRNVLNSKIAAQHILLLLIF